jgi:hypothetical protein
MNKNSKITKIRTLPDELKPILSVPTPLLLKSLENTVAVLQARGEDVVDWDDKSRRLCQFRIIGGKAYFLAEKREGK